MRLLQSLTSRLRSFFQPAQSAREVEEELRLHLDFQIEENLRRGMSPLEARQMAGISFGSIALAQAGCSQATGTQWLRDASQDLRYGVRTLWKHKSFSLAVITTLALGIGACAAMFSVDEAVLLRSLPYGDVDRIVYLYTPTPNLAMPPETFSPSSPDFQDIQHSSRSFESMAQFRPQLYSLRIGTQLTRVGGAAVGPNFFRTLGVLPQFGDLSGINYRSDTVVIAHSLWQDSFNGRAGILNESLFLDGKVYRIVGVMPPDFTYPNKTDVFGGLNDIDSTQVWVPLLQPPEAMTMRDGSLNLAIARLKPGISLPQAQLEARTIMSRLDRLHQFEHGWTALLVPLRETALGPVRKLIWLLQGAVFLVLLIACGNAGALLSARATHRSQEMGMRSALGASRGRLVRQMLGESLVFSMAAGALGTGLASIFLHMLLQFDPGGIPRMQDASINGSVLLFILLITLLVNVVFSILPALSITRLRPLEGLRRGGSYHNTGQHRKRSDSLVVGQLALVVVLLSVAGLLLRSYRNVLKTDTGVSSQTVATEIELPFGFGRQSANQFFQQLAEILKHVPGIQAVGLADRLPLSGTGMGPILVEGFPNQPGQLIQLGEISGDYLSAMEIPLVEGRQFLEDDPPTVAIVNQAFARTYLHGRFALGQRIRMDATDPWTRIVGVVPDIRTKLEETPTPLAFFPITRTDIGGPFVASEAIVLRSTLPLSSLSTTIQTAVRRLKPELAIGSVQPVGDSIIRATSARRFQVTLLSLFSFSALLLAMVGLYGLLSYTVQLRTSEFGIRMAVGASRAHILALVLRHGMRLLGLGLALGLTGSILLLATLSKFLYQIRIVDPTTFCSVFVLLFLGTVAACLIPGLRAANISPTEALRIE